MREVSSTSLRRWRWAVWPGLVVVCLLGLSDPQGATGPDSSKPHSVPLPLFKLRVPSFLIPPPVGVSDEYALVAFRQGVIWRMGANQEPDSVPLTYRSQPLTERSFEADTSDATTHVSATVLGVTPHGRYVLVERWKSEGEESKSAYGAVPVSEDGVDLAQMKTIELATPSPPKGVDLSGFIFLTGTDDLSAIGGIHRDGRLTVWRETGMSGRYEQVLGLQEPLACGLCLHGQPARLLVYLTVDGRMVALKATDGIRCWETRVGAPVVRWAFDSEHPRVAVSVPSRGVDVYEYDDHGAEPIYHVPAPGQAVAAMSLSSGQLAVAYADGRCELRAIDTGRVHFWQAPGPNRGLLLVPLRRAQSTLAIVESHDGTNTAGVYRLPGGEKIGELALEKLRVRRQYFLSCSSALDALITGAPLPYAWDLSHGRPAPWTVAAHVPAFTALLAERQGRLLFNGAKTTRQPVWYDPRSGVTQHLELPEEANLGLLLPVSPSGRRMIATRDGPLKVEGELILDFKSLLLLEYSGMTLKRVEVLYKDEPFVECTWVNEDRLLCWRIDVRIEEATPWYRKLLSWIWGGNANPAISATVWFDLWDVAGAPRMLWSIPAPTPGDTQIFAPYLSTLDESTVLIAARNGVGMLDVTRRRIEWVIPSAPVATWSIAGGGTVAVALQETRATGENATSPRCVLHVWSKQTRRPRAYRLDFPAKLAAVDDAGRYVAVASDQSDILVWKTADLLSEDR